jgi:hypothetical protein
MMRKFSLSALVATGLLVGGLSVGSASAADLGGNCCADLEERIAELEATTARKGNRKVSLTVSGWVAEQVMYWDDGFEHNTYVTGLGTTLATNVKFTGQATIMPGYYAGYVLHIEADGSDGLTISQVNQTGPGLYSTLTYAGGAGLFGGGQWYEVHTLQSFWFLKSDHLGKVSIGLQSQASDNAAILVDGSGSLVPANWVAFDSRLFWLRVPGAPTLGGVTNNSGLTWGANGPGNCRGMGGAWGDCNGLTQNAVRYDSPTWSGFSVSASWGQDDFWDVAGRYAGEWNGIKVSAAAAYAETTDGNYNNLQNTFAGLNSGLFGLANGCNQNPTTTIPCAIIPANGKLTYFQAGLYVEHVPTGLWGMVDYGRLDDNFSLSSVSPTDTWYFKGGLRERWHPLGHTVLYGEYLQSTDAAIVDGAGQEAADLNSNRLQVWGLGVVQEVDAAAMSLWLSYRHLSYTDDLTPAERIDLYGVNNGYKDFQYIKFGGLINY